MMLFTLAVDITFTGIIKSKKIELNNVYYKFHNTIGFGFFTGLKIIAVTIILYLLLYPPPNSGAVWGIAIAYIVIILKLIVAYFEKD